MRPTLPLTRGVKPRRAEIQSSSEDTVLVQPGTYAESIHFWGNNFTLASLYLTTGDTAYISATIIDPPSGPCVLIHNGEASNAVLVGFTLTGVSTGTRLENLAWITFDFQTWTAPMDSIRIFNTTDTDAPTSHVDAFAGSIGTPQSVVSWRGDDPGSGIAVFQIYVADSVEGIPRSNFILWKTTVDTFNTLDFAEDGHIYSFYSLAIDHVGNKEQKSETVEAQIRIIATDVGEGSDDRLPKRFALSQNYPNQFNATTIIKYDLPKKPRSYSQFTTFSGNE